MLVVERAAIAISHHPELADAIEVIPRGSEIVEYRSLGNAGRRLEGTAMALESLVAAIEPGSESVRRLTAARR